MDAFDFNKNKELNNGRILVSCLIQKTVIRQHKIRDKGQHENPYFCSSPNYETKSCDKNKLSKKAKISTFISH